MRRAAWVLCLSIMVAACAESGRAPAPDVALVTYDGGVDDAEAFHVSGTLELRGGCVAVTMREDGETVRALLRLPSDGADGPEWTSGRLQFRGRSYEAGSTLVFRGVGAALGDVEGVPSRCRDTGLDAAFSATPEVVDLSLDPAARVLGSGAQPRVAVAELTNGGMDAAMRSELAVVGGRCLGVDGSSGGTVLIWPFGTTVSYSPEPVVTLPGGQTYAVGDRLDLGGGFVSEPDDPRPDPIEGLPDACQDLSRFLVSPF